MTERWKPSVTVAAVIERDGRFLLVEEHTPEGLRLNNPAGHLDPGESPAQGCVRETLEETAHLLEPTALVGVYLSRFVRSSASGTEDITYVRNADYWAKDLPVRKGSANFDRITVKIYKDKGRDAWTKLNGKQKLIFSLLGVGVVALFAVVILAFGSAPCCSARAL